jgi:hypothetical protein
MMRLVGLVLACAVAACDAVPQDTEGDASTSGDGSDGPPYTSPCWTVGDWCAMALGDAQCGDRMACRVVPGSGSASGVCVAPCDAADPFGCAVGKCDPDIGACVGEGGVLMASAVCD